jgi:Flp pilus assembly protein TadG
MEELLRRKQLGQSLIELAISTPLLIFMLFGIFNTAVMISDKVIAGSACRQGARLAAEIGGALTNPTLTTAQVDQDVVRNVLAVAKAMNYSTLATITIYSPSSPGGDFNAATDLYDQFDATGNVLHSGFPLTARNQVPPAETSIGVRLDWSYTPPTGFQSFTVNLNEHAVYRASPVLV